MAKGKIVLVQNNPIINQEQKNIDQINQLLESKEDLNNIDILMLPECCITGYNFQNQETFEKSTEEKTKGKSFEFLQSLAKKYNCYVFGGYPEKKGDVYYNSMYCFDRKGNLMNNYQKRFMYTVDEKFYQEGQEYQVMELEFLDGNKVKVFPLICMDLNFQKPIYEFVQNDCDLMIFCANWTHQGQSCEHLINYWLFQLQPLFNSNRKWGFLCSDRVGVEYDTKYIGTSCILQFDKKLSYSYLDDEEVNVLIGNVEIQLI